MLPNKTRRLRKRSSTQTRDVVKTTLGPPEQPSTSTTYASVAYPESPAASQGPLGRPDRIFLLASLVFQNIHAEKTASQKIVNYGNKRKIPLPEVRSEERRAAYELAFNTLKYQGFLEAIITDSFGVAPPVSDDNMSLFVVMLHDFQKRKFLPRQRWEKVEPIPSVALVEKAILRFKTKLAASVARHRIQHQLFSVESSLPETLKIKQQRSGRLPIYAWVNTLKSSPAEVQRVLTSAGFCQVKSIRQLVDGTFCWDRHCRDTLVFPACCRSQLHSTGLLSDRKLAIQDKSCALGPHAVFSLLPEDAAVLLAGRFSGLTVSHTAVLIAKKSNPYYRQPRVYVCVSDHTDAQRAELQQTVTAMGCKNVTLIPEDFQSLTRKDKRLQGLRVILLNPKCSLSAVSDPVEIILQENRDPELLQDLSQGSIGPKKLTALVVEQRKAVNHALMFPTVLAVVYSTYSSHREENEEVVEGALQTFKASLGQAGDPEAAIFSLSPPPISIFKQNEGLQKNNFFTLEPSEESNGCFLAVLHREPEPVVKETPHEVILRAYATGLLDGIGSNRLSKMMRQNSTSTLIKQQRALGSESGPVVLTQTKTPKTKSSRGVSQGHHVLSHTKASQAKNKQQPTARPFKDAAPMAAAPLRQHANTSSPSSSKPDCSIVQKRISSLPPAASTSSAKPDCGIVQKRISSLLPAAAPATDAAPVVRPHLEPKQVVLTLPVVHYKPFRFHSRGENPNPKEPPSAVNLPKSVVMNLKHPFKALHR